MKAKATVKLIAPSTLDSPIVDKTPIVKPVVLFLVRNAYQTAADRFSNLPSGSNWGELEETMWALQFAHYHPEEELAELIDGKPIGSWMAILTGKAQTKANV